MKSSIFMLVLFLSFNVTAQSGIFDQEGKRLYYTEDSDKKHEQTLSDGRTGMYTEKILFRESGKTYFYDYKWEQIISDGKVMMSYNFNRRRWEWVEAAGLTASKFGKKEDIQRIYERVDKKYTTPDQGDNAILEFKIVDYVDERGQNSQKGDFVDEFGHTVFSKKGGGGYDAWVYFVILHNYYQENYLNPDFMERITERRNFVADSLAKTNSIAMAMLELGNDYETNQMTFMGDNFEMMYFTENQGAIKMLDKEEIKRLKNDWLILNTNTYRSTNPHSMPEGGFYVTKKQAKKKGIQGINSRSIVLEVKIKPESLADFQAAMGE